MKCCFIACDHGLGHTRRVVSVCGALKDHPGITATILARGEQAGRFGGRVEHFETRTTRSALVEGDPDACRWHERLPPLDGFDVVVSDNLPEVLEIRGDAILMGSFLWHQALPDIDAHYRRNAERLLARYRPMMIGSALFATRQLQSSTRFVDVGLFESSPIQPTAGTDLLVACGYTDECLDQTTAAVQALAEGGKPPRGTVHVEPRALPAKHPDWMVPADFSARMYSRLAAAVLRPGVGAVTDALQGGARIFCFYEAGNDELKHNARQLEAYGHGVDCGRAEDAVAAALRWDRDKGTGAPAPTHDGGLGFQGAVRAAALIAATGEPADKYGSPE